MQKPSLGTLAALAAAASALFIYLAGEVLRGQTLWFDTFVREGIHDWASPRLTWVMRSVTWLGSEAVLVPLVALLVWRLVAAGRRHAAILLLAACAGGEALDQVLKLVFRRARPEAFFDYPAPIGYSFPSGHSVASCCFYGVAAAILTRRIRSRAGKAVVWAAAALLPLAIGTSRIYLGVHYPSDVLAGYAAAVVWVCAVRVADSAWVRRRPAGKGYL